MIIPTSRKDHPKVFFDISIEEQLVGRVVIELFKSKTPKTVENFCVHGKNGYFNNHIFHRCIKGFMIQTGDPLGKRRR